MSNNSVSLLPLATEVAPQARAALLSLKITAMSLGRSLGALSSGWLWAQGGNITPKALAGAACALLAAAAMAWAWWKSRPRDCIGLWTTVTLPQAWKKFQVEIG